MNRKIINLILSCFIFALPEIVFGQSILTISSVDPAEGNSLNIDSRILIKINQADSNTINWLETHQSQLRLYFNHIAVSDIQLKKLGPLSYTANLTPNGQRVLKTWFKFNKRNKIFNIALGSTDGISPYVSNETKTIKFYTGWKATVLTILIAVFTICFWFIIIWRSNLIRNACTDVEHKLDLNHQHSFSLAKTQLAFWTNIIAIVMVCQYFFNDGFVIISNTAWLLLGMGAVTRGTSYIMDSREVKKEEKGEITRHQNINSRGFWTDILTDENGLSIQRLQKVIFHIIGAVFFIYQSFRDYEIPELDNGLLILMGVSSATYLGLKTNENANNEQKTEANLLEKIDYLKLKMESKKRILKIIGQNHLEAKSYIREINDLQNQIGNLSKQLH